MVANSSPNSPETEPMRSVHTANFHELLRQLEISLVVSTYQAGKLIVVRADGDSINTHFKMFNKPMGLAADREKIAIGAAFQIWELRNVPAVTQKLDFPDKHDACYLPRNIRVTGDIDIHEMAYLDDELWFVNTRFSCLCTLDRSHSFVPRWKPPFITAYDLRDRCHLNGLGIRENRPKYVTALGETDTPNGWRERKADGGILMDIESNEFIARRLSMPHSPRWYRGKLWVLESGNGSLATVDLDTGKITTVAELPGFTRGIDFYENLAFIGLSQVRETAVFSGIPITERLKERICGVWVVNIDTGQTVAFLRFEDAVQEIFAIQVLPGILFPEVIDWDTELMAGSYVLPDEALAEVVSLSTEEIDREIHTTQTTENADRTPHSDVLDRFELGNRCYHQGQLDRAIAEYQCCLQLDPNFILARYNLGVALGDLERWDDAIAQLKQVIDREPKSAQAYNQLGLSYSRIASWQNAIDCYDRAVSLEPNFAQAHFNLGMTLLQVGNFQRGFTECEWRWKTGEFTPFECPHPKWNGEDISDKTLLVHTEQGAGDAIQFIRFLPQVKQKCQRLLLCCPQHLEKLFSQLLEVDEILLPGTIPLSAFDTYIPLMSLPYALGTTIETIPDRVPYLHSNSSHFSLPNRTSNRPKIGFVWGGSPTHKNDRNRSCPLEYFIPILERSNVEFYSLQKGDRTQDLSQLPNSVSVEDLSSQLHDFTDTAAAIAQLDLVISVDTSVAHLAGAMGKPVWTLLCYRCDWRWMCDREDTPWYPTMRLFRQSRSGDWKSLCDRVCLALEQEF
ncbi:TIGR03032 family protein [Baaleninema simplex]|uniref:TIGR03032 family protein n=1 Tax=Baaleninema simplex TaxID=2862350 RepID=UPI000346A1C2|nr:TIGR03032 family protein [Baaleninema simplex]